MRRFLVAAMVAIVSAASLALAEAPKGLTWDDLVPALGPLENPLRHLSEDQQYELALVAQVRAEKELGLISEVSEDYEDAVELTHKLESEGVEVDALLAAAAELGREIERRNQAVVGALDGQLVRMPGYALPLEFTEGGVREFLLVPYIGACIHVPPPPPNQIVFVQLDRDFVANDLYTPVWVTGRIKVQQASRALSYVDGQADIATGYTLDGVLVEPYEE